MPTASAIQRRTPTFSGCTPAPGPVPNKRTKMLRTSWTFLGDSIRMRMQLVRDWLFDETNRRWTIVVDWSIYLLVGNNASVRINMAAEPGYVTGNLEINKYSYTLTNSAIKHWDYKTVSGLTVSHIEENHWTVSLIILYDLHAVKVT
jgi:hypothetical protein